MYWSNSASFFFPSSLSHMWVITAFGNALKIQQKYTQYVTMATHDVTKMLNIFLSGRLLTDFNG